MALRTVPLVNGEIYHIFNRSVDRQPIFIHKSESNHAIQTLLFYRFENVPLRLSYFLTWTQERKQKLLRQLEIGKEVLAEILCYSLMPNHFHLVLKQKKDRGISIFLSKFQNSFTRYFNTKHKRKGHLFESQFKAVHVETDEQLLHLSRYVHLNPYTSHVVKDINNLLSYPWSSLQEYLNGIRGICYTEFVLSRLNGREAYRRFLFDNAEYQRTLGSIKHLVFDQGVKPKTPPR